MEQTFEDLLEKTKEIERTMRRLRKAEAQGDLISQRTFQRRLGQLVSGRIVA